MAGTGFPSSPLSTLIANRARLTKVRTTLGLEGQNNQLPQGNMQPVGPANGPAPKAVVGPQAQAAMGPDMPPLGQQGFQPPPDEASIQAPADGNFPAGAPPEQGDRMKQMVEQFLSQHGANQQHMIDQEAQQAPPPEPAPTSPLTAFFQATGRMPTAQELMVMGSHSHLSNQMGREPTPEEIAAHLQGATSG